MQKVRLRQPRHGEREIAKSQRDYLSDFIRGACYPPKENSRFCSSMAKASVMPAI